jgi:hypothetical protein
MKNTIGSAVVGAIAIIAAAILTSVLNPDIIRFLYREAAFVMSVEFIVQGKSLGSSEEFVVNRQLRIAQELRKLCSEQNENSRCRVQIPQIAEDKNVIFGVQIDQAIIRLKPEAILIKWACGREYLEQEFNFGSTAQIGC